MNRQRIIHRPQAAPHAHPAGSIVELRPLSGFTGQPIPFGGSSVRILGHAGWRGDEPRYLIARPDEPSRQGYTLESHITTPAPPSVQPAPDRSVMLRVPAAYDPQPPQDEPPMPTFRPLTADELARPIAPPPPKRGRPAGAPNKPKAQAAPAILTPAPADDADELHRQLHALGYALLDALRERDEAERALAHLRDEMHDRIEDERERLWEGYESILDTLDKPRHRALHWCNRFRALARHYRDAMHDAIAQRNHAERLARDEAQKAARWEALLVAAEDEIRRLNEQRGHHITVNAASGATIYLLPQQ